MSSAADPGCSRPDQHGEGCITCGDVAVWLRVVTVDAERQLAGCADERGRRELVATELVGGVRPGDALLVHAGTALHRDDAAAAPPEATAR